nr:centromere protein P isoform X2 [Pelodiscus sinensis]|eukprot:XP_025042750.1 centromere protein P isoform X2 [Pelodiscus sinensis]
MENDIYQVYEDEIHSLEEEIEMLTQKFENNEQESTFYSDEEIQVSGKSHQGDSKWHESPPDLKPELECLKSDLSFLMKFTGIWFTNYSKETVEKTGNKIIQKHRLSGNCCSLPFQMEFQLLEIQDDESIPAVVTDLSIIMECGEYSDLSKFVSCAEEQGSLLQFFRSLSFFAEWYEHRKCTFQHFKHLIPSWWKLHNKNPESNNTGLLHRTTITKGLMHLGARYMSSTLQFCILNYAALLNKYDYRNYPKLNDFVAGIPEAKRQQNKALVSEGHTIARTAL